MLAKNKNKKRQYIRLKNKKSRDKENDQGASAQMSGSR